MTITEQLHNLARFANYASVKDVRRDWSKWCALIESKGVKANLKLVDDGYTDIHLDYEDIRVRLSAFISNKFVLLKVGQVYVGDIRYTVRTDGRKVNVYDSGNNLCTDPSVIDFIVTIVRRVREDL